MQQHKQLYTKLPYEKKTEMGMKAIQLIKFPSLKANQEEEKLYHSTPN
jgi:hypothetical protein